jgi:PTS system sucrose-specific IIC component
VYTVKSYWIQPDKGGIVLSDKIDLPSSRHRRAKDHSTEELARRLIDLSGGPDNMVEVIHCTTRIRLKLKNYDQIDEAGLRQIKEVQNINKLPGQLQIIVGPELVYKLHRKINLWLQQHEQTALKPSILESKESELQAEPSMPSPDQDQRSGIMQRIIQVATIFSDILIPILPLFIAAGILLGLVTILQSSDWVTEGAVWFRLLQLLTSSAFQIISVLFGYHAVRRFGGTPAIGAVLGIAMSQPDLAILIGSYDTTVQNIDTMVTPQFSYQGAMMPIILAALIMAWIEKGIRRILPASASTLLAPAISLIIGGTLAILLISPVAIWLGEWIGQELEYLFIYGGTFFGFILGGIYSTIVLTGLHQGIQALEVALIADPRVGVNFLLPIWSMANMAQGGAGLAVYLTTRNNELRKVALSGSITAFLGITEPIALGVNLKLGRPFLSAAIGGAVGGAYVGFHHVIASSFGLTGIPMLVYIIPFGEMNFIHYMIGFLLSAGIAFMTTLLLGAEKPAFRYHILNIVRKFTGGRYEN